MNLGDFQDRRSNLLRDSLRYNWWVVLVFMVIGALLGAGFAIAKPARYSASATLILTPIVGNPYTPNSNADTLEMLQTEAVSVTSQAIMEQVVDQLDLALTPQAVRSRIRVTVPANTQALEVTYTGGNRLLAPDIVDKVASLFLSQRADLAQQTITNTHDNIQEQINQAQDDLDRANRENQGRVASSILAQIIALRERQSENDAQPTYPGRVLSPPLLPSGSQQRHVVTFAVAGMIVMALLGVGLGLWRERGRDRIRAASDLDDYAFDAPVTAIHGRHLDDEALRHLRMRLAPQIRDHGMVSIVGLSRGLAVRSGVMLANSLSRGSTRVLLIDGTGTEHGHRDVLNSRLKPGLAELLNGNSPEPIRIAENFAYLPAGRGPEAAAEHLVEERARTLVHGIAEPYDLTLVATVPLDIVEGEALARLTEGVLLLVELDRTSHYDLGMALRAITSQGHKLLAVFVVPAHK